jgi:putative FmdB family regulatory protein
MPTYEYKCPKGHQFDLIQKMSEEPRAECPECGSESERQISAGAGFLFKGDGFYITDSRSDSYKKDASKEESGGVSEKKTAKKPKKAGKSPAPSEKVRGSGSTSSSTGGSSSEES